MHLRQASDIARRPVTVFYDALRIQRFKPDVHEKILHTIFTQRAIESEISNERRDGYVSSMMSRYARYYKRNMSRK